MDLNLRPADYESAALPTELSWHEKQSTLFAICCQAKLGLLGFSKFIFLGLAATLTAAAGRSTTS